MRRKWQIYMRSRWSKLISRIIILSLILSCFSLLFLSNSAHAFSAIVYTCKDPITGDQVNVGGEEQVSASCLDNVFGSGISSSSANLATGEMKSKVVNYSSGATLSDFVTIHGPFPSAGTIPVTLSMHIHGRMVGNFEGAMQAGLFDLFIGTGSFSASRSTLEISNPIAGIGVVDIGSFGFGIWQNQILSLNASDIDLIVSVEIEVSSSAPIFFFTAEAGFTALPGVLLDFSQGAVLSLTLPPGFSFTSDSGVFLTQAPGTAPGLGSGDDSSPGSIPENPLLPCTDSSGQMHFSCYVVCDEHWSCALSWRWYDPPPAEGYTYALEGGATFLEVAPPPASFGFGPVQVVINNTTVATLNPGQPFFFPPGVTTFDLRGFTPQVDAANPTAFPTFLNFIGPVTDLTMTPIVTQVTDTTPPVITISTPANTAYLLNQAVAASYSCTDDESGVASCLGTVANGANINTSSVGAKMFTVSATDKAGNTNSKTNNYSVQYASSGTCYGEPGHAILQPINANGSSVFKQGSTVPAKFRVCDANGVSIGTAGIVKSFNLVQTINGTVSTSVNEAVVSTTSDSAFRWDATAQQWIFNISTKNLTAGKTYVYNIMLNDNSSITFQFGLK
jgi:hypothetical protein